jgi:hypothetical protein
MDKEITFCSQVNFLYFLMTKPLTRSQLSVVENALKLTYGNVEF